MYITMFSGKFNCDRKERKYQKIPIFMNLVKPPVLIIYSISERKERIVDSRLSNKTNFKRNGNERKRYMLERTSHKIKTQG